MNSVNYINYPIDINGIEVDARFTQENLRDIFYPLLRRLTQLQEAKGGRILVMLAAPPGAGKSTLASFLQSLSRQEGSGLTPVTAIGMDGFHRRQEYLTSHFAERGGAMVSMVKIKGAPVTFDLELLTEAVQSVAAGEERAWPVYDRMLHNPVYGGQRVIGDIVLLEGNYLLLDEDGWRDLARYADYTISITADPEMLRERLIRRKAASNQDGIGEAAGKDAAYAEAVHFVEFSDLYNARLCLAKTKPADLQLELLADGSYREIAL